MGDRIVRRASLGSIVAIAVVTTVLAVFLAPPAGASRSDLAWDLRPRIVWKPIPFPDLRKDQMAAYSQRHYGKWGWRLRDPLMVVQHFTDGTSFDPAWQTFAANSSHLGEKPGTCAHFIIDTDGTIYQLVERDVRCRHVIGLNDVSIGIEHVGRSARGILRNRAMMRSSMRLTLWLIATYRIEVRNVIGHAESLESPYHHERYRDWQCMTHADFGHRSMRIYRERLREEARRHDVPVGPSPEWVDPDC